MREAALKALRKLPDEELTRQSMAMVALLDHASAGVRTSALAAIGDLPANARRLAAEYIVIKLQDTDVHVRRAALAALCNKRAAM